MEKNFPESEERPDTFFFFQVICVKILAILNEILFFKSDKKRCVH